MLASASGNRRSENATSGFGTPRAGPDMLPMKGVERIPGPLPVDPFKVRVVLTDEMLGSV